VIRQRRIDEWLLPIECFHGTTARQVTFVKVALHNVGKQF